MNDKSVENEKEKKEETINLILNENESIPITSVSLEDFVFGNSYKVYELKRTFLLHLFAYLLFFLIICSVLYKVIKRVYLFKC